MAENWYYKLMGMEFGPVSFRVMADMVQERHLAPTDEVRRDDWPTWQLVDGVVDQIQKPAADAIREPSAQAPSVASDTNLSIASDANLQTAHRATPAPDGRWYCYLLGQQLGPLLMEDLCRMVTNGELAPHDLVKQGLHGRWVAAGRMPGLYFTRVTLS